MDADHLAVNASPRSNPPTLLRSAVESPPASNSSEPTGSGRRVAPLDLAIAMTIAIAVGTALVLVTS